MFIHSYVFYSHDVPHSFIAPPQTHTHTLHQRKNYSLKMFTKNFISLFEGSDLVLWSRLEPGPGWGCRVCPHSYSQTTIRVCVCYIMIFHRVFSPYKLF